MVSGLILFLSAVLFNRIMDSIEEGKGAGYWNKKESWTYKWKTEETLSLKKKPIKLKTKHWWYLGLIKPEYEERFMFSSTILVFMTDGWHLMKFFFNKCWHASILCFASVKDPIEFAALMFFMFIFQGGVFTFSEKIIDKILNKTKQ